MGVTVVYETHTTTTDNERGIATGWLPGALSEAGRREAQELGERRRNDNIAAVFASDLRRAVETAEIAFRETKIPIYFDARLRECNYGAMNGMPVAQFAGKRLRHIATRFPDGESYREVVERTGSFLRDINGRYENSRIVVIGHSANRWSNTWSMAPRSRTLSTRHSSGSLGGSMSLAWVLSLLERASVHRCEHFSFAEQP
jgi:broad specificity phosphatase PhoE